MFVLFLRFRSLQHLSAARDVVQLFKQLTLGSQATCPYRLSRCFLVLSKQTLLHNVKLHYFYCVFAPEGRIKTFKDSHVRLSDDSNPVGLEQRQLIVRFNMFKCSTMSAQSVAVAFEVL